jgi:hypothetical protein
MKLFGLCTLLLSLVVSILAAPSLELAEKRSLPNLDICNSYLPDAVKAFHKLCDTHPGGDTMMTGGPWGAKGKKVGNAFVKVTGADCHPRIWLPQKWCHIHFRTVCAKAKPYGNKTMKFGCQVFTVHVDPFASGTNVPT